MITLQDLVFKSNVYDQDKMDYTPRVGNIEVDDEGRLLDASGGMWPSPMTATCLQQVCTKLGTPPFAYMSACPDRLMATNLNHWLDALSNKRGNTRWLVRTYAGKARAVLSTDYTRIDNTDVLRSVADIMGGTSHGLVRPYLTPDYMHIKITVASSEHYQIGCYVGNGETGLHKIKVSPFIQRTACSNSIVNTAGGWAQPHIHITKSEAFAFLKGRIGAALGLAADMVEAVVLAEAREIPEIYSVVNDLCKKHRFTDATAANIHVGTEGEATLMGLVNGLSYAAHRTRDLDDERRIELEELAGQLFGQVMAPALLR